MFERLLDLCDMPSYSDSLPPMPAGHMFRHATGTNSKFSFVYELLQGLRGEHKQILILARPGRIVEYLEAVVGSENFRFRRLGDKDFDESNGAVDPLTVLIGGTDASPSLLPAEPDVVIAFDQKARSSRLFSPYLGAARTTPVALSLIATHTLDHFDLHVSGTIDALERKHILLGCIFHALELIRQPQHQQPEPHEVAEAYASQLKEPTAAFSWPPCPIPEEVFDVFKSSQVHSSGARDSSTPLDAEVTKPNGRKRQLVCDREMGECRGDC